MGWIILMAIGLGSAVLMGWYNWWLKRQIAQDTRQDTNALVG